MVTRLTPTPTLAVHGLVPACISMDVLRDVRAVQAAAREGRLMGLLPGRRFALVCESELSSDSALFTQAATELGSHVSHVRTNLSEEAPWHEVRHTAHLLGRLYDALECQNLAGRVVRGVALEAGVPVFDGLGSSCDTWATLAALVPACSSALEQRLRLVQAVLLRTLA